MKASRTFRVSVGDLAARSGVLFTGVGRRQAIPTRDLARPEPPTDIWALGAPIRHYVCRAEGPLRAWCILSFMPSLDEVKKGLLQILESNGYDVSGLTGDSQIPYGSAGTLAVGIYEKWNFNIAGDELQGIGIGGSGQPVSLDQLANMIAD
jgi:hypothetical protein